MFTVSYDPEENILHWTMEGFWTPATVTEFAVAMRNQVMKIRGRPLAFDGLCDSRNFPVQQTEVAEALTAILDAGKAMRTGRTAIVVGSMINKMQAGRTLIDPDLRVFLSMDDARAWLHEPKSEGGG